MSKGAHHYLVPHEPTFTISVSGGQQPVVEMPNAAVLGEGSG